MNQEIKIQPQPQIEPITHAKNKSVSESVFGSCTNQNYNLTKIEIKEWWNLRQDMFESYDNEDPNCIKRMKGLWYILTDTDLPNNEIVNEQWTKFGFQQKNPTTDFRGGGIQSLDDIIAFSADHKDLVLNRMCNPQNDYYFAASSINVTFFMKKYFHLLENMHPEKDKNDFCSRRALKNFCQMLVKEDNLWKQLHQMFLMDLFENCWMGLRKKKPNITILDYGQAFQAMKIKVMKTFNYELFHNYSQLVHYYKNLN